MGSYSIHVSADTPLSSAGGATGFDHDAPPSVLSTTPPPVRTNICFGSLPKMGPYRPSFRSPTFSHVLPASVVRIREASVSQYRASFRCFGSAVAVWSPHG